MSTLNQECPKVRQHLVLFAGRDLEEPLCTQVEQHLAGCAACRAELDLLLDARRRIGVFGAQNARGLDAVDLWPEVSAAVRREREAARSEVAALHLALRASKPRAALRRWLPLSLAAAAALVIALGFLFESRTNVPDVTVPPVVVTPPAVPAPSVAVNGGVRVETVSSGSLRRAGPDDVRLRDSSAPFALQPRSRIQRAGNDSSNSLAGDDGLR
ncbi:MAG TPA: zf-HC2 domain-containing protein [Planctomycetota bacterium]|nr:zf-HC2 domain-containing protein [Planctomycetota bacterium]